MMRRKWYLLAVILLLLLGACGTATQEPAVQEPAAQAPQDVVVEEPAGPSAAEIAYVSDLVEDSRQLSESLAYIGEACVNYSGSDAQVTKMATHMALVADTYRRWKDRDAPSALLAPMHRHWLAALRWESKSMTLLARGLDNYDIDLIVQATQYVQKGNKEMDKATAAAETVVAQWGL